MIGSYPIIFNMENKQEQLLQQVINNNYNEFTDSEKLEIHGKYRQSLIHQLKEEKERLEKIIFIKKPPSPEEFIDPKNKWLPSVYVDGLYPYIKQDFINCMRLSNPYPIISMYGCTRCEAKDTEILMYDLSIKKIQDVEIGDILMGDDSNPRQVTSLHHGNGKLYKVSQNKADDYFVNENHILVLQYTNKGLRKNRNNAIDKYNGQTIEISVKDYLSLSKNKKHRLKGIKTALHFKSQDVEIPPYYLGLWLGDGDATRADITTIDKEIKDYIYDYAKELNLDIKVATQKNTKAESYRIVGTRKGNQFVKNNNTLFYHMRDTYNVLNNKHIPIEYLQNSEKIRLELLAGLIDSDGYTDPNGYSISIMQKSERLAENIVFLCRSLGFRANYSKVKKSIKSINFTGEYFYICITGDLYKIPCKLSRKKVLKTQLRINPLRTGIKITPMENGDFYGFTLDGNGRYLHSDLTITHNSGKSVLARLCVIYSMIFINYLRDPHSYYKINKMSRLCIYLVSFKQDKTNQIYLAPILNILDASEMFVRERFEQNVYLNGIDSEGKIHFSEAGKFGDITFPKGYVVTGKDAGSLVGADIVAGAISEISFFKDYVPGLTDDEIVQVFTKLFTRIQNTVGFGNFPCWAYLDSSANDSDSPIEKLLLEDLSKKETTYYKHYVLWEIRPHLYPKYDKDRTKTFEMCVGNGSIPPKIIKKPQDKIDIPPDLIIDVPIDLYDSFERKPLDSIRDIAGRPTGSQSKFIHNGKFIQNIFSNDLIKNIESFIRADANDNPERLIWDQLQQQFFSSALNNKFIFYRAPREVRYIGLDLGLAVGGDATGFTMLHKEYSSELKTNVYVIDFSFAILPKEKATNIEAIICFIKEMQRASSICVKRVMIDTYQSDTLKQSIERIGVPVEKNSVDKSIEPYQYLLTCLSNETLKGGKNIYLKNNLYCLQLKKEDNGKYKVDHPSGDVIHDYQGDFEKSQVGLWAKDVADSCAQALWAAHMDDYIPSTIYEEENKKFSSKKEDIDSILKNAVNKLHKYI